MTSCRLLGHRFGFHADGPVLRWECERGCGAGGEKRYAEAAQAARYARAFEAGRGRPGRRAPLLGMMPLRLFERLRSRPPR